MHRQIYIWAEIYCHIWVYMTNGLLVCLTTQNIIQRDTGKKKYANYKLVQSSHMRCKQNFPGQNDDDNDHDDDLYLIIMMIIVHHSMADSSMHEMSPQCKRCSGGL